MATTSIATDLPIGKDEELDGCIFPSSPITNVAILSSLSSDTMMTKPFDPHEFPFELLTGEKLIEYSGDATDGSIYLTTYRLFYFSNQSSHFSFVNCPLRLIESIEIKENNCLTFQCKDIRSFRLLFSTSEKTSYYLKKFNESIATISNINEIFAIQYFESKRKPSTFHFDKQQIQEDYKRLRLDLSPWRITEINNEFKICSSYPKFCVVPEKINDAEIVSVAKFRSYQRFPTIVWRHKNGAVIARTSQPEIGWLFWRSKEDEKMIQAIINACSMSANQELKPSETHTNHLLILDARSYAAAQANRAKGGGFEYPPYYTNCDVQFLNLPNIHTIRKSAQMLRAAVAANSQGETWLSQLESSRWMHYLSMLIGAALSVVASVDKNARPVLVHCSDGWDRTPQIISLAEIMLDPHYRTIDGFQSLVNREWISFGHKFADRCGHAVGAHDLNERSPVFLQWLDCVYQCFHQDPSAFQFNEMFLLKLAEHTYTCLYGTFLCNNDSERAADELDTRTHHIWSFLNEKSLTFVNHQFNENKKTIIYPLSSVRDLKIWANLYLREIKQTPFGSPENPTSSVPVRFQSFEDLFNSMPNGLQRSTSDSNLHDSIHSESSFTTNTRSTHPHLINPPSAPIRLRNSMSTNSLSMSPQHSSPYHGSHHSFSTHSHPTPVPYQTSLPISSNSDNRIKERNFPVDDSAPDITQLALSYQRYPLSLNSVDSILRNISRSNKHTTSMSSTASSLSDAWSLTRMSACDQSQTQVTHESSNLIQIIRSIRKNIDKDGLTKIPDPTTRRMIEKQRAHIRKIENLHDDIRNMGRFITTLVTISQQQHLPLRIDSLSHSTINGPDKSSCSSWQKIDNNEPPLARWIPDGNAHACHLCSRKFLQWPISRKHHCRECGYAFCSRCANYEKLLPTAGLTEPVRVCYTCHNRSDDINNNMRATTMIESTRSAACPMPLPSGCHQANVVTPNGSFTTAGSQKVKG